MPQDQAKTYIGYVGTTSTRGSQGLYKIQIDADTGIGKIVDVRNIYNSGYIAKSADGRALYALSEGMTFRGKAKGAIVSYDIAKGDFRETGWSHCDGQRPCFVCSDIVEQEIYVANFYGGTISVFARNEDGSLGEKKACIRHKKLGPMGPAIHCVAKSPRGRYLLALELSGDIIYVYDTHNHYNIVFSLKQPAHAGPRHMTFSSDGRYVYVNRQMDEKVSVYAFHPEKAEMLEFVQEISVHAGEARSRTEPAAIRICPGRNLLVVSNRGTGSENREDSLSLFRINPENGQLDLIRMEHTGGQMPRDFCFTADGKLLVVAYQFQGYLDVYRVLDDREDIAYLTKGIEVPSPVCLAF